MRLPSLGFHLSPARYHRLMKVVKVFHDEDADNPDMVHPWSHADLEGWLSLLVRKVCLPTWVFVDAKINRILSDYFSPFEGHGKQRSCLAEEVLLFSGSVSVHTCDSGLTLLSAVYQVQIFFNHSGLLVLVFFAYILLRPSNNQVKL